VALAPLGRRTAPLLTWRAAAPRSWPRATRAPAAAVAPPCRWLSDSSSGHRGPSEPAPVATAPAAAEGAAARAAEEGGPSGLPAVREQSQPAVPEAEAPPESIEDALVRIQRREVLQKVGPQAERYLPTQDPNAFLLPDSRLEPSERKWQKIFVALPWAVFACMLAAPLLLVRTNLPWLQRRAEAEREAAEARNAALVPAARIPAFEVVNFGQMPDVLERPFPTILLLFDPATLASKVFLPALRDLEAALRAAGIAVSVAGLDLTASPGPPADLLWEYPRALAPHIQLLLPRTHAGETGIVDYDGPWTAAGLAEAARKLEGPYAPAVPPEELVRLDGLILELREALFELLFVEDGFGSAAGSSGSRPWWRRAFSRAPTAEEAAAEAAAVEAARAEVERTVDLSAGIQEALASCQVALGQKAPAPGSSAGAA